MASNKKCDIIGYECPYDVLECLECFVYKTRDRAIQRAKDRGLPTAPKYNTVFECPICGYKDSREL